MDLIAYMFHFMEFHFLFYFVFSLSLEGCSLQMLQLHAAYENCHQRRILLPVCLGALIDARMRSTIALRQCVVTHSGTSCSMMFSWIGID